MRIKLISGLIGVLALAACETHENPLAYQSDTHGRGNIEVFLEDSYKPLFTTSIYTFQSLFPKATVKPSYLPEGEIVQAFFDNKVKTICISREFTDKEKKFLKSQNVQVQSDLIAYDAVALIIHPDNTDTTISVDLLKEWISSDGATWKGSGRAVKIVFDKVNSANFNYLTKLSGKSTLSKNVYALNSNEQVIDYVKHNKQAIGVIGVNWISDQEDL
jgi:phosphate transport system substrate-binding protein